MYLACMIFSLFAIIQGSAWVCFEASGQHLFDAMRGVVEKMMDNIMSSEASLQLLC